MWCYSLRFPRIRRIKMNQSFMDCLTFQELQEMGRFSATTLPTTTMSTDIKSFNQITATEQDFIAGKPEKRVRFVMDERFQPDKHRKSDFFIHLSHKIRLSDREKLTSWFDFRGFELIWSLEAALKYSERKILVIAADDDSEVYDNITVIPCKLVEKRLQIEGAYFRILDQG